MEEKEAMKEALKKKKSGLTIGIMVGKPKEEVEPKEHGEEIMEGEKKELSNLEKLAMLVKDNPEASAIVQEMLAEQSEEMGKEKEIHGEGEEEEGEVEEEDESEDMTSGMSDYDKQDVMSRPKPRSLFERAQKEALMKKK